MTEANIALTPPGLTEKYSMVGFREVKGHKVQVGIGEVSLGETQVDVEVLPGCSKVGLLDTMQKITAETGKPTRAIFNEKPITVKPRVKIVYSKFRC